MEAFGERDKVTILIVDDDPYISELIEDYLSSKGYETATVGSGQEALTFINREPPDIYLIDIRMPGMSGLELLRAIRERDRETPVIMVTAIDDTETAVSALKGGAYDYITKPIDFKLLMVDIERALEKGRLEKEVKAYREDLEGKVEQRTMALNEAIVELESAHDVLKGVHLDTIYRLALAAEYKTRETPSHLKRVSDYSVIVANALGWSEKEAENIRVASIIHDIGKIGIPDTILLKPKGLDEREFEEIKKHTTMGYEILVDSESEFFKMAQDIVLTHHERWDGTGYPSGMKGEDIPMAGRIVAVADVFDSLTSSSVYSGAVTSEEAYQMIGEESGKQFDPQIVRRFLGNKDALEEAQRASEGFDRKFITGYLRRRDLLEGE